MKTKHTPGQWRAEGCAVYQDDNWKDGNNLGGKFICGIDANLEPDEERFANASLIAAAPFMLEVLMDCKESLTRLPNVDGAFRVTCLQEIELVLKKVNQ